MQVISREYWEESLIEYFIVGGPVFCFYAFSNYNMGKNRGVIHCVAEIVM